MGANCCVASKDKPQTCGTQLEVSVHRNVRHSPSWSFRWDNRTHIEDIMDSPSHCSRHNSGDIVPEAKGRVAMASDHLSDAGSPSDAIQTIRLLKTSRKTETSGHIKRGITDQSMESNSSSEVKDINKPSIILGPVSDPKHLTSLSSMPSTSSSKSHPLSSRSHSLHADPDSLKKARHSPGYQLNRQISDNWIPSLKHLNESSSPEGRQSFAPSICSNDPSAGGSHGSSSDGWSMCTFSKLVASSQRERWSLDSETISSINTQQSAPLSPGQQTCEVCSKQMERSLVATNVVAVLVCGHVYHAGCLEKVTSEADKFDPPCPLCTHGDKQTAKLIGKTDLKVRGKKSRNAAASIEGDSTSQHQKRGKGMGASLSMKSSSSGKLFLQRHFSIGSQTASAQSLSEGESTTKKGLWTRYFKE